MTLDVKISVIELVISVLALIISGSLGSREVRLARQANALPVMVDLFREYREDHLVKARTFVRAELPERDVSNGLASLTTDEANLVRDLSFYCDNLGSLVLHGMIDIEPVSGFVGGSIVNVWERMEPLITAERARRDAKGISPGSEWQCSFENLVHLIRETPPIVAMKGQKKWRLPR